jgi:excinuclease ABC subunit A
LQSYFKKGYENARVDDVEINLRNPKRLERYKAHNIDVLIDRITIARRPVLDTGSTPSGSRVESGMTEKNRLSAKDDKDQHTRISEAVEVSSNEADGLTVVRSGGEAARGRNPRLISEDITFSTKFSCPDGHIFEELEPRLFSFNSPFGACETCLGLGYKLEIDPQLVMPDQTKTIDEGAILPWSYSNFNFYGSVLRSVARDRNIKTNVPVKNLSATDRDYLLFGSGELEPIPITYYSQGHALHHLINFNGIVGFLESRFSRTDSDAVREEITKYMSKQSCEKCHGHRLRPEALSVKISGKNIDDVVSMSISDCLGFFKNIELSENEKTIADKLLKEISARLSFLENVGLNYLTLSRYASTLSGGETQRIRLASQIGSGLVGVLYVLDEPSIGLHQRDNRRLLQTLKDLRDLGNSVLVIEHDEETMRESDYIIDIGPGAGIKGGEIVAQGRVDEIMKAPRSLTGEYLKGEKRIEVPEHRRKLSGNFVRVVGAKEHNLKKINVNFPVGSFVVVTGVSGSGKSTLVNDVLYRGLCREIGAGWEKPGAFEQIEGREFIDKIIDIDQSPIGRTPRSNPATYTKCFDVIRQLFSATVEARLRGYQPGRFSFNVSGGRCEKCHGDGVLKVEMHFLPDVYIPCDVCRGARYNRETLEVKYKNKNISEVLALTVDEAVEMFGNIPGLSDRLRVLQDVGLGYIKLGQPATTLSGGEAQRIKLSSELGKRATGKTLYILDEPTTGLHFDDVKKLLEVLNRLVEAGNTVVVIEHNLDVVKTADYIIDLGPEGGDEGGKVIAAGTPEAIAGVKSSYTGQFLKTLLGK